MREGAKGGELGVGGGQGQKRRENGSRELCLLHSAEIADMYGAFVTVRGPGMCIDLCNSYNRGNRNFSIPIIQMSH